MLTYQEYAPALPLQNYVACYWTAHSTSPEISRSSSRILPDGCADILFHLGTPSTASQKAEGPGAFIIGIMSQAELVQYAGPVHLLGVRFRPGAFRCFFPIPQWELADQQIDFIPFWPHADDFAERLAETPGIEGKIRLLDEHLLTALKSIDHLDPLIPILRQMEVHSGKINLSDLKTLSGWSTRHLERLFRERLGLGPKEYSRILRFRRTLHDLSHGPGGMAALAQAAGYSDQAHFSREFKNFTGISPLHYIREKKDGGFIQDANPPSS